MSTLHIVMRSSALIRNLLLALFFGSLTLGGVASATTPAIGAMRAVAGLEEPLIASGTTTRSEDEQLGTAIKAYTAATEGDKDFAQRAEPLVAFVEAHPSSAWRMAILTNLGLGYYHAGYFSKAETAWEAAWSAGRGASEPQAKALADRALGELARMYARVGNAEALERLLKDVEGRAVTGSATELITGAHEGLWMFRNDWGIAYLCGPKALHSLLVTLKADPARIAVVDAARSGRHGFTLAQVAQLAEEAGLGHKLVFRAVGEPVPVPSVINWKMNHYAAIVAEQDGRYHIKDPTFGGDLWVSKAAIDAEGSGYFLVPTAAAQSIPWRMASAEEAQQVYGMGYTSQNQPGSTSPCDTTTTPGNGANVGMCAANATSMVVSLNLTDTPVGYTPAKGPTAAVQLVYNQREAYQPAIFSYFNVGQKWTLSVLSWIQDNPNFANRNVLRYVAGGGAIDYSNGYSYNSTTGEFSPERQGQAVLVRIPATGPVTSYELRKADGSKQVFAKPDGATSSPRRIFLTRIVDAAGNALTLNYDAQQRLVSMTDATGRNTTFSYSNTSSPLLVTRITDPFGRFASITYDGSGRLSSITDVIGITSSFSYDASGLVNAMTTPYGTSLFSYGQDTGQNTRYLQLTDPMGFTERVEFRHQAPGLPYGDSVYPSGFSNDYLYYRNTFYWDKHVYPLVGNDYTKARITHWLHNPSGQTSPIIESIKLPLERRVWQRYPGQSSTYYEGSSGTPIQMARVLDDGTTQSHSFTYNAVGKPLTSIDPVGRKTVFTYDANGIDLIKVEQQTSAAGALSTIGAFTYNAQHLPLTYTDAAGQTTRYTYNAAGQVLTATNALNEETAFTYDGLGRLVTTTNANGAVQESRSYDAFDRVATTTDSEGYTRSYSYDALDRITQIAYPDGTRTTYTYDRLDLASITDRQGRTTRYTYDANRRLATVVDPLSQTTRYGYYRNGVLASITDPNGNTTNWDIDIQSRPTAKHYANGNVETYTYEASTSRPKTIVDPLGQVKTFGYTRDDRVNALAYTNSIRPTANVAFTFDAFFPRPATMTDGLGTTTFKYQPVGALGALRLASDDGPYNNDTVSYSYDALGRVATRTVDTAVESFAYDRLSRATNHVSTLGSFARTYLGETGQLTSQMSSNGVGTTWSYASNTDDRRLQSIANSGQARSFAFATTPESNIAAIAESVAGVAQRSWQYVYDDTDRLIAAVPSTGPPYAYAYDQADNLTSNNGVSLTHTPANQIYTASGTAFTYDAAGNLTNDGIRTYQWDAEGRLIRIGYVAQPANSTTLRYDGLGRRLAITDTSVLGTTETRQLWCGEMLCQARNSADQVTRRYYTEGVVVPQSGQQLYYGTDQLGSVRDLLAMQNGSKVGSFDYDPYGQPVTTGGRTSTEFRYAQLYYHGQSGLYLANYRAYNPRTAQWLSRDPIVEQGGLNLYGYAGGNPVLYSDKTGEVFGVDNILEGAASVAIGKTLAWATGQEYGFCEAAVDFALGTLTSGLSSINKLRALGKILGEGADAARQSKRIAEAAGDVGSAVKEGIYEFVDNTGRKYVGQSGDIAKRLAQHEASGKLPKGADVIRTEVTGGKTAREVAEHRRIQEITGGVPARNSDRVSNQRDPIGPGRRHLLD